MKYILKLVLIAIGLFSIESAYSQKLAVKSNLLYDATSTMNLGLELRLSHQMTIDVSANYNPWGSSNELSKKMKHYLIQPELRYWTCEAFNGHYFGVHSHYAFFNVNSDNRLLGAAISMSNLRDSEPEKYRSEGWLAGAGISYGYHWIFKERWALEGNIGLGYAYMDYDKYYAQKCGKLVGPEQKHYFGVTKLGVTLVYTIK